MRSTRKAPLGQISPTRQRNLCTPDCVATVSVPVGKQRQNVHPAPELQGPDSLLWCRQVPVWASNAAR